jgi:hypothetical protein
LAQESRVYARSSLDGPLRQGEILTDLIQLVLDPENINFDESAVIPAIPIIHPFAITVSQDCDLDWDFRARQGDDEKQRLLPNVLFCVVATASELRDRTDINSSIWSSIKINKNERYHFLQKAEPSEDILNEGLPELGIDFKRYFTIPTNELYFQLKSAQARRRCRLISPYLEHLNTRFAYFLSRVALPEDHYSEPASPQQ